MGLENQIEKLRQHKENYELGQKALMDSIEDIIRSVGQNPAVEPLSRNCFIIHSGELINSPWSPQFHNWEIQADLLLGLLVKKPFEQWISLMKSWAQRGEGNLPTAITIDKVQLNRRFIAEVLKHL